MLTYFKREGITMIEQIRANLKSKGIQIVLWLVLLSLAGGSFVAMLQFSSRHRADSIATVNDQDIGYMEYRRKLAQIQQMVQEVRKMYGAHADMVLKMWGLDKNPHEAVMEGLIGEKVFQSAADGIGSHVSKEYMHTKLRDPFFVREFLGGLVPPQALTKNGIDTVALKYNLERQGISEDEFEESLKEAMKRVLFQRLLEGALYVPRSALRDIYAQEFLKRKVGILAVSFDEYLKRAQVQKLADAEIEKYYDKHKEEYRIPEKRSAKLYTFEPETYGITIPEKDIESAYHKRKQTAYVEKPESREILHIVLPFTDETKVAVRAQIQEILKEVKANPEAFEKIAQEKSKSPDKGTKIAIKKGVADKLLEKAVWDLELNEISPPVETKAGFEIIKLVGKTPAVYKPLDKVKDSLLASLKSEKFRTEFSGSAPRVLSQAADLPEIYTKYIAEHKGVATTLDAVTRSEAQQASKLFGLQKVGDRAFYTEGNKGFIIELTGITPSVLQPLTAVKEKVTQAIYNERAKTALELDLNAARDKIAKGESLDTVAKPIKGTIEITDWLDPQDRASLKKLQDKGIAVNKVMGLTKVHDAIVDSTPKNGYLIELREIEPFNEADFLKKQPALEYEMRKQEESNLLPAFMDGLRKNATVKITDEFAKQTAARR